MLKNCLPWLIFCLFFACTPGKPSLPPDRPADLKVDYHLDGGMTDYAVDINIFSDSCHYRRRQEGKVLEKTVKLSPEELNSVYNLLKQNEFDKMELVTDKGIVYDRGGESVTVSWDKKSITISNAQSNFVKEKWFEKWKMICEGLDQFALNRFK